MSKQIYKRVLVISDLHCPYQHQDATAFLAALKAKYRPDKVILSGDEVDYHAISFHDADPDLDSAGVELQKAIQALKPIYKLFPRAVVLHSNHGSLIGRKALAHGLPKKVFRSYNEILEAPKDWEWVFDYRIQTPLGKVYFHHSKGVNGKKNSQAMGCSFVMGHHHEQMDIQYWGTSEALMFGMTVGCLVDPESLAMAYNKNNLKRPVLGCGLIIDGKAILIPMVLTKKGRWNAKI